MTPNFPVLFLNIGLHPGPNQKPCPSAILASNALYQVALTFGRVYSCEILPGKDEPTLVVAVYPPANWQQIIENMADELCQDTIACVHTGDATFCLLGQNTARLTWDASKFIKPRIFYCMAE